MAAASNLNLTAVSSVAAVGGLGAADSTPFRFYDNRQKYLAFVNTCNEKSAVARRAAQELVHLHPTPPAIRIFDAGMGDATVLADRKSTRLNSSHIEPSRMPSSA